MSSTHSTSGPDLNPEILDLFPPGFRYWESSWYHQFREERRLFRFRILTAAFLIGSLVPVVLLVHDLLHRDFHLVLNYLIPLAGMLSLSAYLLRTRRVRFMIPIALGVCSIGFFCAALLPGARSAYFLMFFAFPQLAFILGGVRRGRRWILGFLGAVGTAYLLVTLRVIPHWYVDLDGVQILVCTISYLLLFAIGLVSERQHERDLFRTVRRLVYDEETRLPNKEVLKGSIDGDRPALLAIIQLVNFSDLLAVVGEKFSGRILRFASGEISRIAAREGMQVYKMVGLEFGLLHYSDTPVDPRTTERYLHRILEELETTALSIGDVDVHLSYRIGAAVVPPGQGSAALSRADAALRTASLSKDAVAVYDHRRDGRAQSLDAAVRYKTLIDNRRDRLFRLVYQPVIDNATGQVAFYECLLRVRTTDGAYESIYPYLPVAVSTGFYPSLTEFVLHTAVEALATVDHDLSINISNRDIRNPAFIQALAACGREMARRPNRLIFEILEGDAIDDWSLFRDFIDRVHADGGLVAMDDFGSGYANFVNLANFNLDLVKIDGSLVRSAPTDDRTRVIMESIQSVCAHSGLRTVAEFVETETIFQLVKSMGIHCSQGYFIGHPAPDFAVPALTLDT